MGINDLHISMTTVRVFDEAEIMQIILLIQFSSHIISHYSSSWYQTFKYRKYQLTMKLLEQQANNVQRMLK